MYFITWSLSITVSTTGFHPVNAGSTPAEITILERQFRNKLSGKKAPDFRGFSASKKHKKLIHISNKIYIKTFL